MNLIPKMAASIINIRQLFNVRSGFWKIIVCGMLISSIGFFHCYAADPDNEKIMNKISEEVSQSKVQFENQRLAEAEFHAKMALEWYAKLKLPKNPNLEAVLNSNIAYILLQLKRFDAAFLYYCSAMDAAQSAEEKNWQTIREIAFNIAQISLDIGQGASEEALEMAKLALSIDESQEPIEFDLWIEDLDLITKAYVVRGDYDNAIKYQEKVVNILLAVPGGSKLSVANQLGVLGQFYIAQKLYTQAERRLVEAKKIIENEPDVPLALRERISNYLAIFYFMQRDYVKSLPLLQEVEKLQLVRLESIPLKKRSQLATLYSMMGDIYFDKGELNASQENYQKSLVKAIVSGRMDDIAVPHMLFKLGQIEQRKKNKEAQIRLFLQATRTIASRDPSSEDIRKNQQLIEAILKSSIATFEDNGLSEPLDNAQQYLEKVRLHSSRDLGEKIQ